MPVSQESLENFARANTQDAFLGVAIPNAAGGIDVHLALVRPRNGSAIPQDRWSRVGGQRREPLPGGGGHAQLVQWSGGAAQQIQAGQAAGNAAGFSLVKTGRNTFETGTFRSGFNGQYQGQRPGFARGTPDERRTLREQDVWAVLGELTAYVRGGRARRHSI